MSMLASGKFWIRAGIVAAALLIAQQIWHWEIERVEVPAGQYLVRVHRWGKNLGPDEIVAPDPSYKGVMLDVLPEGRHFLNPIFWSYERRNVIDVPKGKCLVLTRRFGKPIPPERIARGEVLADHDPAHPLAGNRGVVRDVLGPGSYRLNPYAYSWEEHEAVQVRAHEVGVRTLLVGEDPPAQQTGGQGRYVVPDGKRGIQQTTLSNGTYYINPYLETITTVEVRAHRVELTDIVFPSRDGFLMKPVVVVEYAVLPERTPEMLVRLSDVGQLHQLDSTPEEQAENEILQKVILPHIRGYARIEGSNFFARDFITTESTTQASAALSDAATKAAKEAQAPAPVEKPALPGAPAAPPRIANARERMQRAMFNKVKEPCRVLGVDVRAVVIADMPPPEELADQIAQRELAKVELAKNASLIRQFKAQQDLDAAKALKEQARQKVEAETRLVQAKTKANQTKEVAESQLTQELANAQVTLEAAKKQAEALLTTARAEVAVIESQNRAEVAGLQTAVQGFANPRAFAQYHVVSKLAPALREIFASDESEFARIFSTYMQPQPASGAANQETRP